MTPSGSPFHPELRRVASVLPRRGIGPWSLRLGRIMFSLTERLPAPGVDVVEVGAVKVRVHRPAGAGPHPALLWIHGGGMVFGNSAQDDKYCQDLVRRTGCVVAAVDYRLAPEHPFPTPLEDCFDALSWLIAQPDVDRGRVAIGGGSAGGGLAAGLALLVRSRATIEPVLQLLVYPMLDDRTVLRDHAEAANHRLWTNTSNELGWRAYTGLAPGSPDVSSLAAPARAEDLSGLPPAWIGVGTVDLFHDEDVTYAHRLRDAGVPCELEVVPGAFHAFDRTVPRSEVVRDFIASQVQALNGAFHPEA